MTMCFGGGSKTPPQPAPQVPGVLNLAKAEPDPAQAAAYRGEAAPANTTGRYGGSLLLDAADTKAAKTATLGGT
jgi:hypothetical protein